MRNLCLMRMLYLCFMVALMQGVCNGAEVVERVVAIVDDEVVLLSEFEKELQHAREQSGSVTKEEVIDRMVNRIILLREAAKFGLKRRNDSPEEAKSIVNAYVDRRIRAFIHIPYDQLETYYAANRERFGNKEFYEVKEEIEEYLVSREMVQRLRDYIEEQRRRSYIRIQLDKR